MLFARLARRGSRLSADQSPTGRRGGVGGTGVVKKVYRVVLRSVSRALSGNYHGAGGMADEWWSTISHRSPLLRISLC
jgi:hypothetical protein